MNRNVRRAYTSEFKEQAVALMSAGRPVGELAQELGVSSNLRALRRELDRLRVENDILKKAAIVLGTRLPSSSGK